MEIQYADAHPNDFLPLRAAMGYPHVQNVPPCELPSPPTRENVHLIASMCQEGTNWQREQCSQSALRRPGFLPKLLALFKTCEAWRDGEGVQLCVSVVTSLIFMNEPNLVDAMMEEEVAYDVFSALEYDPDATAMHDAAPLGNPMTTDYEIAAAVTTTTTTTTTTITTTNMQMDTTPTASEGDNDNNNDEEQPAAVTATEEMTTAGITTARTTADADADAAAAEASTTTTTTTPMNDDADATTTDTVPLDDNNNTTTTTTPATADVEAAVDGTQNQAVFGMATTGALTHPRSDPPAGPR